MPGKELPAILPAVTAIRSASFDQSNEICVYDNEVNELVHVARDEERKRIARELHDDLGQRLVLLSLAAAEAADSVPVDMPDLALQLQSLHREAAGLSRDLRRLAIEFHLPADLSQSLRRALRDLAADYRRRKQVRVRFRAINVPRNLNAIKANHVYRIAQEALRNAARHAGNAPVEVVVIGTAAFLRMEITDFGAGFDVSARRRPSLGLTIMEERARLIHGTFLCSSRKGRGTTIVLQVPLDSETLHTGGKER